MANHIKIGDPVNKAEENVFRYLEEKLPKNYILFTNLAINQGGQDFDFDAIVLGKHAIYVIDIENFGGIIRGDNLKWLVQGDNGTIFTLPKNPLSQAALKARILSNILKQSNPKLSDIYVQEVVCLAGEEKPQIEIHDAPLRLKKIQWYRGIEKFLTDQSQLLHPPESIRLITDDISRFHSDIQNVIQTGFGISPKPYQISHLLQMIRGSKIEDKAWSSWGYTAYLASREGIYPERVLLKIYKIPSMENPEDARKYVNGLAREFTALRKMSDTGNTASGGHKNVVIGYDAFLLNNNSQQVNEYVIVMEWVEGKHLFELINPRSLSLRQKYQIAAQICRGLMFAHSADVVHRNLNLKNILYEPSGIVKIVNFDFAKFLNVSSMSTFSLPNSMLEEIYKDYLDDLMKQRRYVAPEIRTGRGLPSYHDATKETDLYSLGVILLELFSGSLLENTSRPSLNILRNVADLNASVAMNIGLLCSEKVEDRKSVSLEHIANDFTTLAQSVEEVPLPKLPDGYRFGKYEILSCLNRTQMSDVYHAKAIGQGQGVEIEFLHAPSNNAVSIVSAAYKSWSAIDPRYTARWFDEGVAFVLNGKIVDNSDDLNAIRMHYLVMEHLVGKSLKEFLRRGAISPEIALEIGSKIIQAVSAIHTAQWTHREIKPANIILGADNSVRIVGFELGLHIYEPIGVQGRSSDYSPPEVYQDEPAPWSYAGDVYSTACVILALLFGEKTQVGLNFDAQKDSSKLKELVGDEIADLLLRDINPHPRKRHESAVDMLRDWNSAIARRKEEPITDDYEKILQKIDALVKEKDYDLDNIGASAYRNKANQLRAWLKNGKQGDCPIDLGEFGVDVIYLPKLATTDTPTKKAEEKKAVAKPEKVPVAKEENVVSLSPEERTLHKHLKEVREHIYAGRLRQAVTLAGVVASHASGNAKVTASELLEEARQKRDAAVEAALKKADSVFKKGDKEQARQHYEFALDLDPDNEHAKFALRKIDGGAGIGKLPSGDGTPTKFDQPKNNFRISIAYPSLLSKRFESSFLLHIYFHEKRSQVIKNIRAEFQEQKTNEQFQSSSIKLEQKIKVKLFSPVFDFPESVTKLIDNPVNKITFLGMPKDNCEPGFHKVLISISDAKTNQEFESFAVNVRVVDFAFDHVSRPMLSKVSAIVLGVGSFAMFIFTSLEQIDKTVGLTSGTAAGVLALGIYASFYNLYQRVRSNTP